MEGEFSDKLLNFVRSNIFLIALFAAGVILIAVGIIQMMGQKQAQVTFESGSQVIGAKTMSEIKVDVEGAVINPGLYTLKSDARVQDALIAAGGLSSNADRFAINLAAKLVDGQKIYISATGESYKVTSSQISINSASQKELEDLPGIGPVSAQKVIDGRPYSTLEELLSKKVVGKSTFEKIKDLVIL